MNHTKVSCVTQVGVSVGGYYMNSLVSLSVRCA